MRRTASNRAITARAILISFEMRNKQLQIQRLRSNYASTAPKRAEWKRSLPEANMLICTAYLAALAIFLEFVERAPAILD